MNTLILQKQARKLERVADNAKRTLLEFKVLIAKWEIENNKFTIYSSAKALMRDAKK